MKKVILVSILAVAITSAAYLLLPAKQIESSELLEVTENLTKRVELVSQEELDLSETLVARLPNDIKGFLYLDTKSESFKKLQSSVWSNDTINDVLSGLMKEFSLDEDLTAEYQELRENLNSIAAYGRVEPKVVDGFSLALVADFSSEDYLGKLFVLLKDKASRQGLEIEELDLNQASGFSVKDSKSGNVFYLATKEKILLASHSQDEISKFFSKEDSLQPSLLQSEEFKNSSKEIDNNKLVSLAYVDLASIASSLNALSSLDSDFKLADLGLKSLSFSSSMAESPSYAMAFNYDQNTKYGSLLKQLSGASQIELLEMLTSNTVGFFTLDGSLFKAIHSFFESFSAEKEIKENEKLIKELEEMMLSVDQILVSERAAPLGQSLFPIPEILIAVQTTKVELFYEKAKALISETVKKNLAEIPWAEKDVLTTKAEYLLSPFGIGIFLAKNNDKLIITTSELILRDALNDKKDSVSGLLTSLDVDSKNVLAKNKFFSVAYLNNKELVPQLETVKSALSAYLVPQEDVEKFLSKERLEQIKKKGSYYSFVETIEGEMNLEGEYRLQN